MILAGPNVPTINPALTDDEKRDLNDAAYAAMSSRVVEVQAVVEWIVARRVSIASAKVEAAEELAEQWEKSPDRAWVASCGDDLRGALDTEASS